MDLKRKIEARLKFSTGIFAVMVLGLDLKK